MLTLGEEAVLKIMRMTAVIYEYCKDVFGCEEKKQLAKQKTAKDS